MDWALLLQKFFVYGCLGLLIEVFFTGVYSLIQKNWKATAQTYLHMLPIYAFTAIALEGVSEAIPWPFYLKAFVYVPVIYGIEALSGWLLNGRKCKPASRTFLPPADEHPRLYETGIV